MPLTIVTLELGPMDNNTYVIADPDTCRAVVIDPSFDSQAILEAIEQRGWQLTAIWLTHAHFDHIAGVEAILAACPSPIPVGLHSGDLELWRDGGGAKLFGAHVNLGSDPTLQFEHGQALALGSHPLEVRHTPGHTSGHVIFYAPQEGVAFCGDLIFQRSIGRTDLPGGSYNSLLNSIRSQVFSLPLETRLLPGHGAETTVGEEQNENPFL